MIPAEELPVSQAETVTEETLGSPVSGKVVETNQKLAETPELINSDPYGAAWMLKLEITETTEITQLMDAKAYEDYCSTRSH